jgi:hypothetical protein
MMIPQMQILRAVVMASQSPIFNEKARSGLNSD